MKFFFFGEQGGTRTPDELSLTDLQSVVFATPPPVHLYLRRDSNPHAFRHMFLRHTCIPFHHLGIFC